MAGAILTEESVDIFPRPMPKVDFISEPGLGLFLFLLFIQALEQR